MSQILYTEWFTNSQTGQKESRLVPFEQHQIVGGKILLNYLPEQYYGVPITGMVEIKNSKPINLATQYKVDYNASGTISFHPDLEGQTINIPSYYGRGQIYISVERIATMVEGNSVVQTLKQLTDNVRSGYASIIETSFTAITNNTTHISHSLSYDPAHDRLEVYGGAYDSELKKSLNYTENINNLSIDLVGWSINFGDIINFKLYKCLNEDTIQDEIAQAIVAKNNLDESINIANALIDVLQGIVDGGDF